MWLSLVEHLVRDEGVGGSNPLIPTSKSLEIIRFSLKIRFKNGGAVLAH